MFKSYVRTLATFIVAVLAETDYRDCPKASVFPRAFGPPDGSSETDDEPKSRNYEIESIAFVSKFDALITAGSQRYQIKSGGKPAAGLLTDITTGLDAKLQEKARYNYAFGQLNVFPMDSYEEACFFMIDHSQHPLDVMGISVLEQSLVGTSFQFKDGDGQLFTLQEDSQAYTIVALRQRVGDGTFSYSLMSLLVEKLSESGPERFSIKPLRHMVDTTLQSTGIEYYTHRHQLTMQFQQDKISVPYTFVNNESAHHGYLTLKSGASEVDSRWLNKEVDLCSGKSESPCAFHVKHLKFHPDAANQQLFLLGRTHYAKNYAVAAIHNMKTGEWPWVQFANFDNPVLAGSSEYVDVGFIGPSQTPVLMRSKATSLQYNRLYNDDLPNMNTQLDVLGKFYGSTQQNMITFSYRLDGKYSKAIDCSSATNVCYITLSLKQRRTVSILQISFVDPVSDSSLVITDWKQVKATQDYIVLKDSVMVNDADILFTYQITQFGFRNYFGLGPKWIGGPDSLGSVIGSTRPTDCFDAIKQPYFNIANVSTTVTHTHTDRLRLNLVPDASESSATVEFSGALAAGYSFIQQTLYWPDTNGQMMHDEWFSCAIEFLTDSIFIEYDPRSKLELHNMAKFNINGKHRQVCIENHVAWNVKFTDSYDVDVFEKVADMDQCDGEVTLECGQARLANNVKKTLQLSLGQDSFEWTMTAFESTLIGTEPIKMILGVSTIWQESHQVINFSFPAHESSQLGPDQILIALESELLPIQTIDCPGQEGIHVKPTSNIDEGSQKVEYTMSLKKDNLPLEWCLGCEASLTNTDFLLFTCNDGIFFQNPAKIENQFIAGENGLEIVLSLKSDYAIVVTATVTNVEGESKEEEQITKEFPFILNLVRRTKRKSQGETSQNDQSASAQNEQANNASQSEPSARTTRPEEPKAVAKEQVAPNQPVNQPTQTASEKKQLPTTAKIIEVKDDTDFDKEAKFDIFNWIETSGLFQKKYKKSVPPKTIVERDMKEEFALPTLKKTTPAGVIQIDFSSPIDIKNPEELEQSLVSAGLLLEQQSPSRSLSSTRGCRSLEQTEEEMLKISKILDRSQSLQVKLIPGSEQHIDQKSYGWQIQKFESEMIELAVFFDNPGYISLDSIDTLHVVFNNTSNFLVPKDENISPVHNGYIVKVDIPPQSVEALSETQQVQFARTGQLVVLICILVSLGWSKVLDMVLGSILILQVLAHLPLANIFVPATTLQNFLIMTKVVSLDYVPVVQLIDFGFTETDPWSTKFAWLDYKSVNFIENANSLAIWLSLGVIYILFLLILKVIRVNPRSKCLRSTFSSANALTFLVSVFMMMLYEVLISAAVGFGMLEFSEFWNRADQMTVAIQAEASVLVLALFFYLAFFGAFKVKKIVEYNKSKQAQKHQEMAQKMREMQEKLKQGIADVIDSARSPFKKPFRVNAIPDPFELSTANEHAERRKQTDASQDVGLLMDFSVYRSLTRGLRAESKLALMNGPVLFSRRIVLIYVAMFMHERPFAQMLIFQGLSLFSLLFVGYAQPQASSALNKLFCANELITLSCSYLVIVLNGMSYSLEESENASLMLNSLLIFAFILNSIAILVTLTSHVHQALRRQSGKHSKQSSSCLCKLFCKESEAEIEEQQTHKLERQEAYSSRKSLESIQEQSQEENSSESEEEDSDHGRKEPSKETPSCFKSELVNIGSSSSQMHGFSTPMNKAYYGDGPIDIVAQINSRFKIDLSSPSSSSNLLPPKIPLVTPKKQETKEKACNEVKDGTASQQESGLEQDLKRRLRNQVSIVKPPPIPMKSLASIILDQVTNDKEEQKSQESLDDEPYGRKDHAVTPS